MKPTNQKCKTCDSPINGETHHLIFRGGIFRFCSHTHRLAFVHERTQLTESAPRPRAKSFIAQRVS
jgi:hypothetical protein